MVDLRLRETLRCVQSRVGCKRPTAAVHLQQGAVIRMAASLWNLPPSPSLKPGVIHSCEFISTRESFTNRSNTNKWNIIHRSEFSLYAYFASDSLKGEYSWRQWVNVEHKSTWRKFDSEYCTYTVISVAYLH